MRIPAGSFITSYKSTAKACNLSPQQARDDFFYLEPALAPTREQRWALVSVANLESYQVIGTFITTCSTSWITVFSWSRRMSPPIEATRALLVLINAQHVNLADASVWVVAGRPARVLG